ncbi:MAG: hypothetical protein QOF51_3442 [Chloroflexota bacterium]|jgi:hypothetical protein|nr:hypothetical protein [Chloroflexota bacterium]
MADPYIELQRQFGGRYIASRDGDVVESAPTYDDLVERLERNNVRWEGLVIQFVEPMDTVGVY